MDRWYNSKAEANNAISEYLRELEALKTRLGIWEEAHDSCSGVDICAEFVDEDGMTRTARETLG